MDFEELSEKLGVSMKKIVYLNNNKDDFYRSFNISKKSGKQRIIDAPIKDLKHIQRNILKLILYKWQVHESAFGFVPGKSIKSNAQEHANSRMILRLDLRDFFPTITAKRVFGLFVALGFDKNAANNLTELTTFNGHIPQGAPTSPCISNLICFSLDKRLTNFAKKLGLKYTRYADDMVFSGDRIKKSFLTLIVKVIEEEGFRLAKEKTKLSSSKNRQMVTGLVVNKEPNITRKKRRLLRAIIHNCKTMGASSQNRLRRRNFKEHLVGWINYLNIFDQKKAASLSKSIKEIDWTLVKDIKTSQMEVQKTIVLLQKIETLIKFCGIKHNFKLSTQDIINFVSLCENRGDLSNKLIVLGRRLDESLKEYATGFLSETIFPDDSSLKSGELIDKFLVEKGVNPKFWWKTFQDIRFLASRLERHHIEEKELEVQKILMSYGFEDHNSDYSKVWESILGKTIDKINVLIAFSLSHQNSLER